ncbi:MAG: type II toxin-antitoxin system VapC family toxin [Methanobacteriota archaeon]
MSVLVDSSVVIAYLHRRDRLHREACALMAPLLEGRRGSVGVTTDLVDEILTFLVARGATRAQLDRAVAFVLGDGREEGAFVLHRVGPDHFAEALRLLRRHRDRRLNFTDCTSLAVMGSVGMSTIVSFDAGFDGLVERSG